MAEIDLSGKVAIVTGGGRGLGRVMTLSLLEAGARVCAAMHIAQDIEGLRGEAKVRGAADRLNAVVADIRDAQACQNVVAECNAAFGPACILVNNAGVGMLLVSNTFNTGSGTIISLAGVIDGSGSVGGDLINDGGTISPGSASGSVSVVPEPSCLLLVGFGVVGLAAPLRRNLTYYKRFLEPI